MTQFEVATAAGFVALAAARVQAAVIEAGLGGRLDATNTIPSRVTVLTSIGLDHTEWLGETEAEIAAEKLAVLRDHSTLVLGKGEPGGRRRWPSGPPPSGGRRLVRAPEDPGPRLRLRAPGRFQRRNFALALHRGRGVPGRARPRARRRGRRDADGAGPPGADRREAADLPRRRPQPRRRRRARRGAARARRRPPGHRLPGDPRDKDAVAMARALAPALDRVVCTELAAEALGAHGRPGSSLPPGRRAGGALRGPRAARPRPSRTLPGAAARPRARRRAPRPGRSSSPGPTTCWRPPAPRSAGRHGLEAVAAVRGFERWIAGAGSELLSMMALVAAVVAVVILVFFGVGYLFGRLFL